MSIQELKNLINRLIKSNGRGDITGNTLNQVLNNMADCVKDAAESGRVAAIKQNGVLLTPESDGSINIEIPVRTSQLDNDSTYQRAIDVAETIIGATLDMSNGIVTFFRKNGTTFTLDLPTEKIVKSGYYDSADEEIVLVLADKSEIRISASSLISEYFADETTIEQYTDTQDGYKKKFRVASPFINKIDGAEQTANRTSTVSASSTSSQYPTALAVWNAIKGFASNVQTFTEAEERSNIESGETISTVFGKIRKWFSDLKAVAFSGSYNDLSDKPSIGNGKVTIKQKGVEKGSFSLNQTGNATIELTDENTTYGIATSTTAGLVKSGGDITVANDGSVSVNDNSHSHYYEKGVFYGESGKDGFVNFCTITFNSTYKNEPFSIQLSSRSREGTLTIFPNLGNTTILSNPDFFWHSEYIQSSPVWYKVESNIIYLYWQKSENYDEMSVIRINVGAFTTKGVAFTWGNTYVTSSDGLTNVAKNNHYVNCLSFRESNISGYTIDSLWVDLQTKTGCMGSVYLYKKTSGVGSAITEGWYNYIYIPHRDGVYKANGDSHLFGSIILTPMLSTSPSWVLRISGSATAITEAIKLTQYSISDITGLRAELNSKISKTSGWCATNATTPYWFLIASYTCTSEWFDLNTTFIASRNFYGAQAVLMASIRTNTMGKVEFSQLRCLSKNSDFPVDCFAIAFKGTAGSKAEFQIWAKCSSQYQSMSIMPLYFGTRDEISNSKDYWVLSRVNETHTELRADVRADGLFNHPNGFSISLCQVPEYRKLSGCLEITDSNLATYYVNGTLTIPNGVSTVIFNTSSVKTVYLVQGTVQTNGYRLTIGGTWHPGNNSDYQGLEGCFPYYANYHYYGYTGVSLPNFDAYSHFADYVYFNGVWYSKMY